MPPRVTLRQRLRYAFDRTMARGTVAVIGWLGVVTAIIVVIASVIVLVTKIAPAGNNDHRPDIPRQLLTSLLHTFDPGGLETDALGNNTISWWFLGVMLVVTILGLFIVSALIGVIATGFESRLEELRKGRSLVIESGHTLVLGWSPHVFTIISELAIAKDSERKPSLVIVADEDKVEMEDEIKLKVPDTGKLRISVRTGDPTDPDDIAIGNPRAARSIVVLGEEDSEEHDAQVIKTVLAVVHGDSRRDQPYNIVAVIDDPENLQAAELAGRGEAIFVNRLETIARMLAHTSRQSGASVVYSDLLDFDGDEIYFRQDPGHVGMAYGDLLLVYDNATTIGIAAANDGIVVLNPPADRVLAEGESLVAIAEDDSVLDVAAPYSGSIDRTAFSSLERVPHAAQRVLIIGWNPHTAPVVREIDAYLEPGSLLLLLSADPEAGDLLRAACPGLQNTQLEFHSGPTTRRPTLEAIDPTSFDNIIVTADGVGRGTARADADILVTLLQLRDIAEKSGRTISVTSDLTDDRNRRLAQVANVDDVIVSDRMIALMLAQLSENPRLRHVFDDLFDADGSELYLRSAAGYLRPGAATTFATLVAAARERGETAIGYRLAAHAFDSAETYGVHLNPRKTEPIALGEGDQVIVLAES